MILTPWVRRSSLGHLSFRPRPEPRYYLIVQVLGQTEFRMYRGAANAVCVGVLQVGVAGRAGTHGDVLLTMGTEDVCQMRRQEGLDRWPRRPPPARSSTRG